MHGKTRSGRLGARGGDVTFFFVGGGYKEGVMGLKGPVLIVWVGFAMQ
jgi:hypothetical protein